MMMMTRTTTMTVTVTGSSSGYDDKGTDENLGNEED